MSWTLGPEQLDDLARGAAILGTGGGGDPTIGRLLVREAMREHGPVTVLDPDEVADDAFVIPVANMGAPTVMVEKLPGADEPVAALRALETFTGRTADATMPIECGGGNSMIPLIVAARTGLPVVDADGMGRAFPELQMETFHVYGVPASPLAMAGEHGETCVFDTGKDTKRLEDLARRVTVGLGGGAAIAEYSMTGEQLKRTAVPRTLSLALSLGRAVREAREAHRDPVEALGEAVGGTIYGHLRVLFRGKVTDVERRTEGGFARGRAAFAAFEGDSALELRFQNEHLAALRDGEPICVVPDLVCVLEADTGEPITTEALRYGQRVTVIGIAAPEIMRTPEALDVFGPSCFGLPYTFVPVEDRLPLHG
ncbi:DUF917 domain-containing protein [Streptomyces sp. WG-D5]